MFFPKGEERVSGFNLVIENLLISTPIETDATLPPIQFQSRNRESSNFNADLLHEEAMSALEFQSRNRESSNFQLNQSCKEGEAGDVSIS